MTVTLKDSTPPSSVQEEFYQARKKLGDEARNCRPRARPLRHDEYSDVSFALLCPQGKACRCGTRAASRDHSPGPSACAWRQKINILGERPEQIFIEFSYAKLATLGVSATGIVAPCRRRIQSHGRSIDTQGPRVFIRVDGAYGQRSKRSLTRRSCCGADAEALDSPRSAALRGSSHLHHPTPGRAHHPVLAAVMQEGWMVFALEARPEDRAAAIAQTLPLG